MSGGAGSVLHGMELETCPFGELRHGAAAFEAVVAHGRADGGGEVPDRGDVRARRRGAVAAPGSIGEESRVRLGEPRGRDSSDARLPPLRPTQAFQQWARSGHTFALLDMEQVGETGGADIPTGALPATAVLASFTPARKNGDAPVLLTVSDDYSRGRWS